VKLPHRDFVPPDLVFLEKISAMSSTTACATAGGRTCGWRSPVRATAPML